MAGWRRSELKAGVYDEIVSARLDRQLAALGAPFEVCRSALTVSEPIGAVLESLLGDGFALALAELKADSAKGLALAEALLAVLHSAGAAPRDSGPSRRTDQTWSSSHQWHLIPLSLCARKSVVGSFTA